MNLQALSESLGWVSGWVSSPWFGVISSLRRARTFHPSGSVFAAQVEPIGDADAVASQIGRRLAGPALVRLSGALWRGDRSWPDVLGCAVRFRRTLAPSPEPESEDQDLLFATVERPWWLPFAPLLTRADNFLANDYFGVSPFDVPPAKARVFFRLRPSPPLTIPPRKPLLRRLVERSGARKDRLASEVATGHASFVLQMRLTGQNEWKPIARIALLSNADVDQERLRFSPFRDGRGIVPRGFVHALRHGVYAVSQMARPRHGEGLATVDLGAVAESVRRDDLRKKRRAGIGAPRTVDRAVSQPTR